MIAILIGKSGSGKDTILAKLCNKGFTRLVTMTTRPPREDEVNGVDYNFVTLEQFKSNIFDQKMIEYRSYTTLVNKEPDIWYYGTPKRALEMGKDYAIVLEPQCVSKVSNYYGKENCMIFSIETKNENREKRAMSRAGFDKTEWDRRAADDEKRFAPEKINMLVDAHINNDDDNVNFAVQQVLLNVKKGKKGES